MRVLVTGGAGWTAVAINDAIRRAGHQVVAFDLPTADPPPGADRFVPGDVARFRDVLDALAEVDAVVHLAVAVAPNAYDEPDLPFAVNVKGTYNVFEAARRTGVGPVVLLSEAPVHLPPTRDGDAAPAGWRSNPGPDHLYDLTKRLQEEIAKDFCATHGITAVALRAGHIVDGRAGVDPRGRPLAGVSYAHGGWVCRYDVAAACVKALTIGTGGYRAYDLIGSHQARARFDVERTERDLGFAIAERFAGFDTLPC